jgi:uncharacterized protein
MSLSVERRNTNTVMAYYECLQRSDSSGMAGFLADDLEYQVHSSSSYAGGYDRQGFLDVLPGFFESQVSPLKFDIKAITAQDDRVCVYAWGGMPLKAGGYYGNIYHYLFRLRDDKITAITEVCAPLPAGVTI